MLWPSCNYKKEIKECPQNLAGSPVHTIVLGIVRQKVDTNYLSNYSNDFIRHALMWDKPTLISVQDAV